MSNKKLRAWMLVFQQVEDKSYVDEQDYLVGLRYKVGLPTSNQMQKALMNLDPSKYSFQLEKGCNGRLHYQIFLVLKEPLTGRQIREQVKSILRNNWAKGCLTTQPLHSQNDAEVYCQKVETRVEGPWFFPKNKYLGQDLRSPKKYYPWQRSILAIAKKKSVDPRSIHVIVDGIGNSGKSELAKYMAYTMDARVIPLGLSSAQMKAAITSSEPSRNYIIDLPRNNKSYQEIFDTIEEIKRGFVVSSFHGKLKNSFFDRPNIFVFTNTMPDLRLMSMDMWRLHKVNPQTKELVSIETFAVAYEQRQLSVSKSKKVEMDI